jgi:hypothetical protein
LLAEAVEIEPAQEKDAVMLAMLASIGIEKGVPFEPDAERTDLLTEAAKTAERYMQDYMVNVAFEPQWPGSNWTRLKHVDNFGFSFYGDGKLDYDRRAGGFAYFATWAPKHFGEPGKPPASSYVHGLLDHDGDPFDGNRSYRVRFPADTPTRDFWSLIVYGKDTSRSSPHRRTRSVSRPTTSTASLPTTTGRSTSTSGPTRQTDSSPTGSPPAATTSG